jgi:hypothetical protein
MLRRAERHLPVAYRVFWRGSGGTAPAIFHRDERKDCSVHISDSFRDKRAWMGVTGGGSVPPCDVVSLARQPARKKRQCANTLFGPAV